MCYFLIIRSTPFVEWVWKGMKKKTPFSDSSSNYESIQMKRNCWWKKEKNLRRNNAFFFFALVVQRKSSVSVEPIEEYDFGRKKNKIKLKEKKTQKEFIQMFFSHLLFTRVGIYYTMVGTFGRVHIMWCDVDDDDNDDNFFFRVFVNT